MEEITTNGDLYMFIVLRCLEVSDSGTCICQKPLFASNLLNTVAPCKWASVSSTVGSA